MIKNSEFLFVYGTLQRGFNNPFAKFLRKSSIFIGKGYIRGKKYQIKWHPGVKRSLYKKDRVYGEIYKIFNSKALFRVLDRYEEATKYNFKNFEFIRRKSPVIKNGKIYISWVYFYQS